MKKALTPIIVAAGLIAVATPVAAGNHDNNSVEVTNGRFQTLPHDADGTHYDVKGGAIMFRTADATAVYVKVKGLAPDTLYPAHVHNQPCSSAQGGGHYQDDSEGGVNDTNEMWPAITTDSKGHGTGEAFHAVRARPEAQSVVIHYPANTSIRLACVDLT